MKHLQWNFTVKLKVAPVWVEDGFTLEDRLQQLKEYFEEQLIDYSHEGEVIAEIKITKTPDIIEVRKLQGYLS